ncbi:MAG: hypothetical protein AB7L09_12480 [Nitrospira sp.]
MLQDVKIKTWPFPIRVTAYWEEAVGSSFQPSPIEILKKRLASGELSIEQYRCLLAEISGQTPHEQSIDPRAKDRTGALILEFEDLKICKNAIVYRNAVHPLSDVTSVRGGQSRSSFNFVPTQNSSSIGIQFASGEAISISEDRLLFGGKRHEAIGRLFSTMRDITFKQRLVNLTRRLIEQGHLELTRPWTIGSRQVGETVILKKEGVVISGERSINLRTAKASGTFGLGSQWHSLNFMSHQTDPYEVVLSEKKAALGALIPIGALKFIPYLEDIDIVQALLAWLAEPNNTLS